MAREEQQPEHDDQATKPQPEADPLDAGVALHAQGDDPADKGEHDQATDKDAGLAAKERGHVWQADRVGERREELDDQDVGVDRGPEPEREPPASDRQHEARRAAQDAALPGVVAAGARHHADQLRIGQHQERHEHAGEQDGAQELTVWNRIDERHAVEPKGHQVDRPKCI